MTSSIASMLDELMGKNRNSGPGEFKEAEFTDDDVCKYFLAGYCPHELFTNTKSDIGPCRKLHDEAMKQAYLKSDKFEKLGYEQEFLSLLQKLQNDMDRKIKRQMDRIKLTQEDEDGGPSESNQVRLEKKMEDLMEKINEFLRKAETLGAEGKVEESQEAILVADKYKQEREAARKTLNMLSGVEPNEAEPKSMEVCDICGCLLIVGDVEQRIEEHMAGKQHMGFAKIRVTVQELIRRREEKRDEERKEREARRKQYDEQHEKKRSSKDRDSDRDRHRDRDRDRDRGRDKNRERDRVSRDKDRDRDPDRDRDRRRKSREVDRDRDRRSSKDGHHHSSSSSSQKSSSHKSSRRRSSSRERRKSRDKSKEHRSERKRSHRDEEKNSNREDERKSERSGKDEKGEEDRSPKRMKEDKNGAYDSSERLKEEHISTKDEDSGSTKKNDGDDKEAKIKDNGSDSGRVAEGSTDERTDEAANNGGGRSADDKEAGEL